MSLKEYKQKRSLKKTPEPAPAPGPRPESKERYLEFVVHKHAARSLHYDLRLEMEGVLKSFAVPKGPSLDPSIKRLAIHVEDHPFDYKDFEGCIPKGNYGAGGVIIWDKGFYGPLISSDKKEDEKTLLAGLKKGDLKFILAGAKLKGEFALVKTGWGKDSWLLLKKKDRFTSVADVLSLERSVVSNKSVEELSSQASPGLDKQNTQARAASKSTASLIAKAPLRPISRPIVPMLPTAIKKPFDHEDWLFEVKWDGYRAIAELDKKNVSLYSRNRLSLANKFGPVVKSLQKLGLTAVLDGEIVLVDESGVPDFQKLQHYTKSSTGNLLYYVFDILSYQDRDLMGLPLIKRKELLKTVLPAEGCIKYSEHIRKEGIPFFYAAKQNGVEGIVAKHSLSLYKPGTRTMQWLKIKNRVTQDCVIAGFTEPRGSRKYLGSLVLGALKGGSFVYIGHSGGGFGAENIKTIYEKLKPLVRKTCPFKIKPPEAADATWVKPLLVCEVAFTGWTEDAVMRQPEFLRLRDDKPPGEAVIVNTVSDAP
jgi:bifunctional non-homologous end joining protein LigD